MQRSRLASDGTRFAFTRAMPNKDPQGGLTAEGRRYFARKQGAHLRPGVKGPADTPEKQRRKGSFLRRHFAHLRGPLQDENGKPTRLALSAHAWGEPVPKTLTAARRLANKGTRLLERYAAGKRAQKPRKKAAKKTGNSLVGNINRRKRAGKSRSKAKSSVSAEAYRQMKLGWPHAKRRKAAKKA